MDAVLKRFYQGLLALSALAMLATLLVVLLSVVSRLVHLDVPGLDAYAGYCIAAALFLALPATLLHGDHIRVSLLLDRLPARLRQGLEWWCLCAGAMLSLYIAWYAARAVWISHLTHDVSPAADATPLWIPQLAMALGCIGFALSFVHALVLRWQGRDLIETASEAAHIE
jgi:TRAP-type C4-dicarboxylate transport system permease small subunit